MIAETPTSLPNQSQMVECKFSLSHAMTCTGSQNLPPQTKTRILPPLEWRCALGLEPRPTVLETVVLPLNYASDGHSIAGQTMCGQQEYPSIAT